MTETTEKMKRGITVAKEDPPVGAAEAPTETGQPTTGNGVDRPASGDMNVQDATPDLLAEFRDRGGVRLSEYRQADKVRLANGDEISSIALAAAGTETADGRTVSDAEREDTARRIDASVNQHAAWLDSRPLLEQVQGNVRPVIFVGPTE